MDKKQEMLRSIPKVDEVLQDQRLFQFLETEPRPLVLDAARAVIDELRERVLAWEEGQPPIDFSLSAVAERAACRAEKTCKKSFRRVINATGVILHTNLGRSLLSERVCRSVAETSGGYSTLEYDLKSGSRGSRHSHMEKLITRLTGAEAGMVVNNNAAGVLLCLSALAAGKEVIVSRGELVEIGGSFRIPDIMSLGGARLREVGTTNKTKIEDYRKALSEETGVIMKVHTSNYRILGFTAEASMEDMAELAHGAGLPFIFNMGSGLMVDLRSFGVDEPLPSAALAAGADLVLFSGDKLLGGPQAGIVAGKKKYVDLMKKHPLARVVRVGKMTLAAMEETLRIYLEPEKAMREVPILSMISVPADELRGKAERLLQMIREQSDAFELSVVPSEGQIGGGSTPNLVLQGYAVALRSPKLSPDQIEKRMRAYRTPVIVRIFKDQVYLDMRTVQEKELPEVAAAVAMAGKER